MVDSDNSVHSSSQYGPRVRNEILNFFAFLKEIDWTEPWLIGLIFFHATVTALTLATRNRGNFQAAFFFLLLILVFSSATLNEIAAKNWKYFSRQQYFDSNGMFISVVFSCPILLNCLVMVANITYCHQTLLLSNDY